MAISRAQLLPRAASPFYGEAPPQAVKGCFQSDALWHPLARVGDCHLQPAVVNVRPHGHPQRHGAGFGRPMV